MQKPRIPHNESERQIALDAFEILDTQTEPIFDDITILASQICETPISLISLIDRDRQWFKSRVGLSVEETPRDISWCGHTILGDDIFEVPDAALDERFKDNPLFLNEPYVRFYAGAPLITKSGHKIGTLCVIDKNARKLSAWQIDVLKKLARQVTVLIESRLREKKLLETNQRLDAIVNNIPVMLSSYNGKGEIDWVNREWTKELGWDVNDPEKLDILAELYPRQQAHTQPDWRDFYTRKRDGRSIYASWTIVQIQNKNVIAIGQNINERKSIETLSQDVQRLTKVGGWQYIIETEEIKWTDEMFRIYGLPEKEGVNLKAAMGCYVSYERAKISELFKRGLDYGESWDGEFEFIDFKGIHKWTRSIGEAVKSNDGKIYKLKGTFQDITELKTLQLKLETERRISLHQARLASIGHLASGVAHEINNPLAIIKGYLSVLKETNDFDTDTLSRLSKINNAADRIKNIVNGLRTFSRSDVEEIGLFDLSEVLNESINLVRKIYFKENISLTLKCDESKRFKILGNRGRMAQIIMNLLANAKDAISKTAMPIIEVSLTREQNSAVLQVKDNGKGIDRSIKDKIFDPFFTTKDVNEGTGIGLSIVNSIVKEHEGLITFDSVKDQGSTFTVKLPLDDSSLPTYKEEDKNQYSEVNYNLSILVVDDEEDISNILKILLNNLGMKVTLASNGEEAFKAYSAGSHDLILTDIKMPVMNGPALIKKIRSSPSLKQPKIIVMTGGVESDHLEELESEILIDGFLYKPFNDEVLFRKIQEAFPQKDWEAAIR